MTLFLSLLALIFCTIPLHELGHYIFAKRFGFQNIKLGLMKWHKIPMGFIVTGEKEVEFKSDKDVFKWHFQTNGFQIFGSLFSVLGYLFFGMLGIFSFELTLFLSVLMLGYGLFEVSNPKGLKTK